MKTKREIGGLFIFVFLSWEVVKKKTNYNESCRAFCSAKTRSHLVVP